MDPEEPAARMDWPGKKRTGSVADTMQAGFAALLDEPCHLSQGRRMRRRGPFWSYLMHELDFIKHLTLQVLNFLLLVLEIRRGSHIP
jgi:hypothetical protein